MATLFAENAGRRCIVRVTLRATRWLLFHQGSLRFSQIHTQVQRTPQSRDPQRLHCARRAYSLSRVSRSESALFELPISQPAKVRCKTLHEWLKRTSIAVKQLAGKRLDLLQYTLFLSLHLFLVYSRPRSPSTPHHEPFTTFTKRTSALRFCFCPEKRT